MGVRILKLTNELLSDLLKIPPGTEVVGISNELFSAQNATAITVEHPDFSPVEPGHAIPELMPIIGSRPSTPGDRIPVFLGWGQSLSDLLTDAPVIVEGPL